MRWWSGRGEECVWVYIYIYSLLKYSKSWMVAKSSPFSCLSFLSYLLLLDRARQLTKSCYTWSKWFTIEFQSIRRYPAYNKRSLRMSWKKFGAKNVPDDEWRFTRASLRGLSADFSSHDFVQNILKVWWYGQRVADRGFRNYRFIGKCKKLSYILRCVK